MNGSCSFRTAEKTDLSVDGDPEAKGNSLNLICLSRASMEKLGAPF